MIAKKIIAMALAASTFLQISVHAKDGFPMPGEEESDYKYLIGRYQDAMIGRNTFEIEMFEQMIDSKYGGCNQFPNLQKKTQLTYAVPVNTGCIYTLLAQDEIGGRIINYVEKYGNNSAGKPPA